MRSSTRVLGIVSVFMLLMMVIWSAGVPAVYGKAVKEPVKDDSFLYVYFSEVMGYFEYSMMYALENNTYSVTLANLTAERLGMIYREALYYHSKGIPTKVMTVVPPFYSFSKELVLLDGLVLRFQKAPSPALAAGIRAMVGNMEGYLRDISSMRLFNGSRVLRFNVNGTMRYLRAIDSMVSARITHPNVLSVDVSSLHPVLNETVIIFGSAPRNGTVEVFVVGGNRSESIKTMASSGMFSVPYKFKRLGSYSVYAVQGSSRSRRINVTVVKIPVSFVVSPLYSAVMGRTVVVSGQLIDLYGRPVGGEDIIVRRKGAGSGETGKVLTTASNGSFSIKYGSSVPISFEISLVYPGDDVHSGGTAVIEIRFTKIPVSISLYSSGKRLYGSLQPPLTCNLSVFVNGVKNFSARAVRGRFSFSLRSKVRRKALVYVYYPGNDRYSNATSNVVYILPPSSKGFPDVIPLIIAFAVVVGIVAWSRRVRAHGSGGTPNLQGGAVKGESQGEKVKELAERFDSVPEAYAALRRSIVERFNLSPALTPRELVEAMRGWKYVDRLMAVTSVHEKVVYAGVEVSEDELVGFMENVSVLLGVLGGAGT